MSREVLTRVHRIVFSKLAVHAFLIEADDAQAKASLAKVLDSSSNRGCSDAAGP